MGGIATYEMTKTTCITRPKILSIQITHARLAYSQRQGFDSVITLARQHLRPPPQSTCPPIGPAIDALSGYLEPAFYLEPCHRVIGRRDENTCIGRAGVFAGKPAPCISTIAPSGAIVLD
jgi:hypothetical protein